MTARSLPEWAEHARAQAAAWRRHGARETRTGWTDFYAADWRALARVADWLSTRDAMSSGVWPEQIAAAVARLAAHLPTAPTERGDHG